MRQDGVSMTSGMYHGWRQVVSGWRQDDVTKMSRQRQDGVRMASGNIRIVQWRQECVRMRHDGVRQASHVCQGRGVGVRMRQGGVRII